MMKQKNKQGKSKETIKPIILAQSRLLRCFVRLHFCFLRQLPFLFRKDTHFKQQTIVGYLILKVSNLISIELYLGLYMLDLSESKVNLWLNKGSRTLDKVGGFRIRKHMTRRGSNICIYSSSRLKARPREIHLTASFKVTKSNFESFSSSNALLINVANEPLGNKNTIDE